MTWEVIAPPLRRPEDAFHGAAQLVFASFPTNWPSCADLRDCYEARCATLSFRIALRDWFVTGLSFRRI
jgi:hypothetical protein